MDNIHRKINDVVIDNINEPVSNEAYDKFERLCIISIDIDLLHVINQQLMRGLKQVVNNDLKEEFKVPVTAGDF